MERYRRDGAPVSVMMFDLDRFKAVNDRHGHAVGDAVIRKFCEITTAAIRPNDVFGRIGGEEFAVVLPGSSIEAAGSGPIGSAPLSQKAASSFRAVKSMRR